MPMDSIFLAISIIIALLVGVAIGRWSRNDLVKQVELMSKSIEQNADSSQKDRDLELLLLPLHDEVKNLREQATEQRKAEAAQESLMQRDLERLRTNSDVLAKALGNNAVRGSYGEGQLEGLLYESGLVEGVHFEKQLQSQDLDGTKIKPDITIKLPGGSAFPVDSKFPFSAYWSFIQSTDETDRARLLDQHKNDVRARIKELNDKNYASAYEGPNLVVLFFPFESILQAALEVDHGLIQFAVEKGVTLTTPATLLGVLRTVSMAWQRNQLAENSSKIGSSANKVIGHVASLVDDLNKVGKNLDAATKNFNLFVRRFDNGFVTSVRSLQEYTTAQDTAIELNHEAVEEIREFRGRAAELEKPTEDD